MRKEKIDYLMRNTNNIKMMIMKGIFNYKIKVKYIHKVNLVYLKAHLLVIF